MSSGTLMMDDDTELATLVGDHDEYRKLAEELFRTRWGNYSVKDTKNYTLDGFVKELGSGYAGNMKGRLRCWAIYYRDELGGKFKKQDPMEGATAAEPEDDNNNTEENRSNKKRSRASSRGEHDDDDDDDESVGRLLDSLRESSSSRKRRKRSKKKVGCSINQFKFNKLLEVPWKFNRKDGTTLCGDNKKGEGLGIVNGRLHCTLCNVGISEIKLIPQHLGGKGHRENVVVQQQQQH